VTFDIPSGLVTLGSTVSIQVSSSCAGAGHVSIYNVESGKTTSELVNFGVGGGSVAMSYNPSNGGSYIVSAAFDKSSSGNVFFVSDEGISSSMFVGAVLLIGAVPILIIRKNRQEQRKKKKDNDDEEWEKNYYLKNDF
jgi:hypothetical protein